MALKEGTGWTRGKCRGRTEGGTSGLALMEVCGKATCTSPHGGFAGDGL